MAEGLLLMGVGRGTRLLRFLADLDKEYEGTGRLGIETDTLDAEGTVTREAPVEVSETDLRAAMGRLTGSIEQTPPAYSAVKVGGRPLYRTARAGGDARAAPREVRVDVFELLRFDAPDFDFRVVCSGGTYVRSLVADVGAALGCGAHLTRLVRTRIGPFPLSEARPPDAPELLPLEAAVGHLPSVALGPDEAAAAGHGRPLGPAGIEGPYAVIGPDGSLIGVYADRDAKAIPEVIVRPG
jgi:tRNA pseudouridine55 synthase